MTQHGLTDAGVELVVALLTELGEATNEDGETMDDYIEGFTTNHHPDLINEAAAGDVPALVELRTACGLPIFR